MTPEGQRSLIGAGRRVVFAGLVLLLAWLVLLGLRGTISPDIINQMNAEMRMESTRPGEVPLNPWSWDWSRSLWSGEPVAGIVSDRLGTTLGLIGAAAVISLILAQVLLFIGMLISRATGKPEWLVSTRGILRLVLVSAAVSAPFFAWEVWIVVSPGLWWGVPGDSPLVLLFAALFLSALPTWLLVQYGQGETAGWPEKHALFDSTLWLRLSLGMAVRLLKLIGVLIILSLFVELGQPLRGLGRLFVDAVNRRDFPIIFGIAWAFALITVLVKLAADLIEIACRRSARAPATAIAENPAAGRSIIPKAWVIVSLVLVGIFLVVAVAAPILASHGFNEFTLGARLQPPSSQYVLGTDDLGRDLFSRLVFAVRQDVLAGLLAATMVAAVAAGWAILAARVRRANDWQGDTLEDLVMLPRNVLCAFPWLVLLLLLAAVTTLPTSEPLSFTHFVLPTVLVSSLVLLPRAVGMMQEAYQSSSPGKSWIHGVLLSIPVMLVFAFAGAVLYVATASYAGFGVRPPFPELGGMLSGTARRYMLQAPWMAVWPSAALILLLFAFVMAGEALLEKLGFHSRAVWGKVWE
jgi:ABC-type dipeptide/oligopeptide/nickel transport system permease subunit/ABC-type dipeptide/oligopeptide/nickel transport system permease component